MTASKSTIVRAALGLAVLLYPLAVYYGIAYFEPWTIALALAGMLGLRSLTGGVFGYKYLWLLALAYGIVAWVRNDLVSLLFYPVLVNAFMLSVFAWSLYFPPTVVERLARLTRPDLPAEGVRYTRRVTQVWCVFFVVNGGVAWATALWAPLAWWSLYNGLIAYLLMGALMACEYWVRIRTQTHAR